MTNKEVAKFDPASVYKNPQDVCADKTLTQEEKIDVLNRWAYDEREMSVAEEENMLNYRNHQKNTLVEINKCLLELGIDSTDGSHPPTKQG